MTNKIIGTIAVIGLLLGLFASYEFWSASHPTSSFGAVGLKLAENYDPYLKYNGGYYSNLPIQTTNTFNAGATILSGLNVTTSNTATSSTVVGCVQTTATSTATPIRFLYTTSATTTVSGTASGSVAWGYGTCPF